MRYGRPFAFVLFVAVIATASERSASAADKRDSAIRRAARAEAFKPIVAGADSATPVAESVATDEDIELIKRAASDPLARPEPIRSRPVRSVVEGEDERANAPAEPARATASTEDREPATPNRAPAGRPSAGDSKPEVSADTALLWLKHGNDRYVRRQFRSDGRSPKDRARVLKGQHPHAIVLACADSGIPPETAFDQGLGEIYVVRVAGEALDSSTIASVEYALEHFGPKLLVVLGHSRCETVESALNAKEGESAGSPDLDKLIADIRPRLKSARGEKPSANLEVEAALNADGAARELVKRSEIVRKKIDEGALTIKTGLYRMDSGKVSFY